MISLDGKLKLSAANNATIGDSVTHVIIVLEY